MIIYWGHSVLSHSELSYSTSIMNRTCITAASRWRKSRNRCSIPKYLFFFNVCHNIYLYSKYNSPMKEKLHSNYLWKSFPRSAKHLWAQRITKMLTLYCSHDILTSFHSCMIIVKKLWLRSALHCASLYNLKGCCTHSTSVNTLPIFEKSKPKVAPLGQFKYS